MYRVESDVPFASPLFRIDPTLQARYLDRAVAVCAAAKSRTRPEGAEIRVIQEATGSIVFRKAEGHGPGADD